MLQFCISICILCTDDVFSFCNFFTTVNYTVLMFALLVANWPFCINKFDLI